MKQRFTLVSDRYGEPVVDYTPTFSEFIADCAECGYHPQLRVIQRPDGDEWWDEYNEPVLREITEE